MREKGLPQVLTWRWAPCAAFVLGAISFAAFMLLAIPDQIGQLPAEATSGSLRFQLARTQAAPAPQGDDWSSDTSSATPSPRLVDRAANRTGDASEFPKRGFTPPLERPDPPPPPAPAAPPPLPPQPVLNLPPPTPPPVEQPPAPAPPSGQPEVVPQASVTPLPDAQADAAPQRH